MTRDELKSFMRRSNIPAFKRLAIWVIVLLLTSSAVYFSLGTAWVFPAMFVHGVVLVHHFSLQHECVHYTVFRTRWLNDLFGSICGVIIGLPHTHFRYEHCDHHTYTQIDGDDPELVPMPKSFASYLFYLTAIPYWRTKFTEIWRHSFGRLTASEKRFIPKVAYKLVFLEARLMLAAYLTLVGVMVIFDWYSPLFYWIFPLILGEPVMRFIRMTEHVGRPTVSQMRENTRTNLVSLPWRFLCWNMNYHAEHHYVSSVPFHALPRLHEKLKDHIHVEHNGYIGAHRDILQQLNLPSSKSNSGV
ncbi:fatty acid desaturase family protein [Halocynthiibacter namhaensis]|uniref:fatty acid desaturase family protein n=1 Tax=Halocynthiibacter namhaensis TaxID=1290553 RepID=UPI001EE18975|nr:fatty acid desaturase family protein [Halocynthiibacter namhaensis]